MPKPVAKILGLVLLVAGVAAAVLHYTVEGNATYSWGSLVIAAVLLAAGLGLFNWGAGISRRRGPDKE